MTRYALQSADAPSLRVAMLVANAGIGDVRVMTEAESLVAAGHNVTVFCLAGYGLASEETQAGVRYMRLREWHRGAPVATSGSGPAQRANLIRSVKSAIAPFIQHALHTATFTQAVAAFAPDIVHAHNFECLPAAVSAAGRCGARVIYDMHDLEQGGLPAAGPLAARWTVRIERRALRRVAATITASPSIAAQAARTHGIPPPTVIVDAPPMTDGWQRQAEHLIALYLAVARGPRGLPAAMARRALATSQPPRRAFAVGN